MHFKVIYILLGLAVLSFAGLEVFNGPCPINQAQYVKNFNQSAFAGVWYALYAYEESEYMDCLDHTYKWHPVERLFSIDMGRRNLSTESSDWNLWFSKEQKVGADDGRFYQWEYYFRNGEIENLSSKHNSTHHYIVYTDYEYVAVVWTCEEKGPINQQNLLVLTKGNIPIKSLDEVLKTLIQPPFDIGKLKYHELEDERCYKSKPNMQMGSEK